MNNENNIEELENLANNGDVGAMYEVGRILFEGNGVPVNYGKAKYYLEAASERGSQKANYYLGKMYYNGLGVGTDHGKAKYYFEKSSESENVFSTYYLGKIYFWGDGVEKDYQKANDFNKKHPVMANILAIGASIGAMILGGKAVSKLADKQGANVIKWLDKQGLIFRWLCYMGASLFIILAAIQNLGLGSADFIYFRF